jgi:iron complex transport system permease protein
MPVQPGPTHAARPAGASSSRWSKLILPALAAVAVVAGSSLLGRPWLSWADIFHPEGPDIFWRLRVPRTLLAAAAGAGLALGGVVFQALFRNPLATPYTLGIASGASVAAATGMFLGAGGYWFGLPVLSLFAFGGALAAMSLIYLIASLRAGRDMTRLLLAGVCVSYMSAAGVMLVQYVTEPAVTSRVVMWLMGSLASYDPYAHFAIAAALAPALAYVLWSHRGLDLIAMGEALAAGRGVPVERLRWSCFVLIGMLVAVIVAYCGPIGFVGLMVPHMARALVGPRSAPLAICSCLLGAAFLALCDGAARTFIAVLPVGVVTNILGAAFFFYLLATRDVAHGTRD